MIAAQLVADDTFHILMLMAGVVFVVACVLAIIERSITMALIAAGLALGAFAWIIVS